MAITVHFLLGLLLVTQICCLQGSEFILENGEIFTVLDKSVTYKNFSFNYPHVKSSVTFEVTGAVGSNVQNLAFGLDRVHEINLDINDELFLAKCNISLKSPNDKFSQQVFRALENFIYNTTCLNENGLKDLAFDTIVGNNEVHLNTITSSLDRVKRSSRKSIALYEEHQRGIDTLVDIALAVVLKKLPLNYIKIEDIDSPMIKVKNMMIGNLTTITRTQPLEIYRKNNTLTLDAAFKIRPHVLATVSAELMRFISFNDVRITASADKIEVRMKLSVDYSVVPCRIELTNVNFTKEKLFIALIDEGFKGGIINQVISYIEPLLTPELLAPKIKNELQKLLDDQNLRSDAESVRSIFEAV